MRRLELLIEDSRRETENEEFTDTVGIQDEEFIRYANDAQERLQSRIAQIHQKMFVVEEEQDVVANQEVYSLPSDIYLENMLTMVEYTPTGDVDNYYVLEQGRLQERSSTTFGHPGIYIRRAGSILVAPVPQNSIGKLRLNYVRKIPKIDIRRATVGAVTRVVDDLTVLTLDTSAIIDKPALIKDTKFSVVDKDGVTKTKGIGFTDIDTSTGIVTLEAFTFATGETIAVGDYLVSGAYAVNQSELFDTTERYLIAYMNWKIQKRDSSSDSQEAMQELTSLESDILQTIASVSDDVEYVISLDYHGNDEFLL